MLQYTRSHHPLTKQHKVAQSHMKLHSSPLLLCCTHPLHCTTCNPTRVSPRGLTTHSRPPQRSFHTEVFPQRSYHRILTTRVVLQRSHYNDHTTKVSPRRSHHRGHTERKANTTQITPYQGPTTKASLQRLYHRGCTKDVTPQILHHKGHTKRSHHTSHPQGHQGLTTLLRTDMHLLKLPMLQAHIMKTPRHTHNHTMQVCHEP